MRFVACECLEAFVYFFAALWLVGNVCYVTREQPPREKESKERRGERSQNEEKTNVNRIYACELERVSCG